MFKPLKTFLTSNPWMTGVLASIRVAFVVALIAAVASLFKQNYYRSDARILPVEGKSAQGSLGGLAAAAAAFGINTGVSDAGDANFVDILQSRWIKEKLLKTEFSFNERSWYLGRTKPHHETLENYLHARNLDIAIQDFGNILTVSRDLKTKVILVSVETPSPELSQAISHESLRLLEEYAQRKGQTRGSAKAAFAEARLGEARTEMSKAEDALRSFLDRNRNFQTSVDPAIRITAGRLETELKLSQQLVMTLAVNREQALMEEKSDIPILNILDSGNLPIEKSRPSRASLVLSWFLFAGLANWVWLNRIRLIKALSPPQDN